VAPPSQSPLVCAEKYTQLVVNLNPGEVWLDDRCKPLLVLDRAKPDRLIGIEMADFAWLEPGHGSGPWTVPIERSTNNGLDEDMHVNCAFLMSAEPKTFGVLIGNVDPEVLARIAATTEEMTSLATLNERVNRFRVRDVRKYDYDVALSFAGANRSWASAMAERLVSQGLRVFYDEYEKANLWGKDLVQHLDGVYRLRARCCIVFVSKDYASSVWTSHELKSALARALVANEEYLLPVRLDNTDLPGLRPSVSYLTLKSSEDVQQVADLLIEKFGRQNLVSYAEFSAKWLQNILQINDLWGVDCLAFCVDPRFVMDEDGFERRVGISYGINLTSPRTGFLAPPEQKGANVFGLHLMGVLDDIKLCMLDQWVDSLPARTTDRIEDAVKDAYGALSQIDDEEYLSLVSDSIWNKFSRESLSVSTRYLLDEFDISIEMG
jgi:TIR domain